MSEGITPIVDLIKPAIGGSKTTWGNRWNENADKIDSFVAGHHDMLGTSIQNGGNGGTFTRYDGAGNAILPADNLTDPKFRTFQALAYYVDALVDDPLNDIPLAERGALVPQRFVRALLDDLFPVGTIMTWGGLLADLPSKYWKICDGSSFVLGGATKFTPNLVTRFVLGAQNTAENASNPFAPGSAAGTAQHVHRFSTAPHFLTEAEIPVMTGRAGGAQAAGMTGAFLGRDTSGATNDFVTGPGPNVWSQATVVMGGGGSHVHTGITDGPGTYSAGPPPASVPIDLYPPYVALLYIMKYRNMVDT